jgi:hypothetical protein
MSRDASSRDPRDAQGREPGVAKGRASSRESLPPRHPQQTPSSRPISTERKPEALDSPRAHYLGDRAYFLRESELKTLVEVGTFRAVAAPDLARLAYGGDTQRMEREIRRLKDQSLVSEKVVRGGRNQTIRLLALTRKGARLARNSGSVPDGQTIYHGFVKPREAKHDADLYRLYHAEAQRIAEAGGRLTRVVLDYELKRDLNRDLAALPTEEHTDEMREGIAERHGLTVVDGKIPLPDMRIEYDTAEMEHKHLDLELATRNYRPRALAEKAAAGFSLYAPRADASRLRRALDDREITAEILSL